MQDYKFPATAWSGVGLRGKAFVSTLLCAPPRLRPSTETLLDHPWITDSQDLGKEYLRCVRLNSEA